MTVESPEQLGGDSLEIAGNQKMIIVIVIVIVEMVQGCVR
jgi:hypothetical protein